MRTYLLNHVHAIMTFPDLASLGTVNLWRKYRVVDEIQW